MATVELSNETATPFEGENSRILSPQQVVDFLSGQLKPLPYDRYKRLALGLADASVIRRDGRAPILVPFKPSAGRLIYHLPDALATATTAHQSNQPIDSEEKSLAQVIDLANRTLKAQDEEYPDIQPPTLKKSNPVQREEGILLVEFPTLTVETEEKQREELKVLGRLDTKLKTATVEEYGIFLEDLQTTISLTESRDTKALFVKYLPKALQYSLEYSADKDKDWRTITELGNYVLLSYIESHDQNEVGFNLSRLRSFMRKTFNADLDNPFIAAESLPPLEVHDDPELNRSSEQDRNNVNAIKRARFAKKVSTELAEGGDLSTLSKKTLKLWGVSEADVIPNVAQIILEGQDAGDKLTRKYWGLIRKITNSFSAGTRYTPDDSYEIGTEAFMLLLYEFDPNLIPLKNYIGSNLKSRMIDIIKGDKDDIISFRSPMFRETKNVIRFLEEHGLPINPGTIQQALDETFSNMTVEDVLEHSRMLPKFTSLERVVWEGDHRDLRLGDTLTGEKSAGSQPGAADPTFKEAADEIGEKGVMDTLLDHPILDERDRKVLRAYYSEGKKFHAIGKEIGLTESMICRVHASAIRKIRAAISGNQDLTTIVEDAFAAA